MSALLQWASGRDSEALYIWVTDKSSGIQSSPLEQITNVLIKVEPKRLYPAAHFSFSKMNRSIESDSVRRLGYSLVYTAGFEEVSKEGKSYTVARIPFKIIGHDAENLTPIRVDVRAQQGEAGYASWRPHNPLTPRLILGTDNPDDLGWLIYK